MILVNGLLARRIDGMILGKARVAALAAANW